MRKLGIYEATSTIQVPKVTKHEILVGNHLLTSAYLCDNVNTGFDDTV